MSLRPPELRLPLPALDAGSGLWSHVVQKPSPHCDSRPAGAPVSLLVVHAISLPPSQFGGGYIDDLFLGALDTAAHPYFASIPSLRVSAHACVFRDGRIHQYVPTTQRAWHAGESSWQGEPRCNDFSIGIELEGDDFSPFSDAQYLGLARLAASAMCAHPAITLERLVAHSDIAPGRKTDPGPYFDWPRFRVMTEYPR